MNASSQHRTGTTAMALEIEALSVFSRSQTLVQDISLQIAAGSALTLLGESGSGKSLLAQAVMGNLSPGLQCSGALQIGAHRSQAAAQSSRHALWGREIGLLPQEPWLALDPTMRVGQQIAETYQLVGQPAADSQNETLRATRVRARELTARALRSLGLQAASHKYPHMISGGMAQRIAFLATHAAGAPLMIIDEPTKGLDHERRAEVLQLLRTALVDRIGLLTITHDVWLARALGGQVAVMLDGRIVEQGPAEQILSRPQHAYTRRLLAADPANWTQRIVPTLEADEDRAQDDDAVIVRMQDVAKGFGAQPLLSDINLAIRRGEFVSITGPSGSGKTTLGNIVLGLAQPDRGRVQRRTGLARFAMQKIYQDPTAAFAPGITLRCALQDLLKLHRLGRQELQTMLERLRLRPGLLDRLPSQVSGGELQRFALARVLMLKPALIFADEPTSRLDPITQQETLQLLKEHAQANECAVLLVTHDRRIAGHLADRELALHLN
ncbi:ATP-binding cassette domain-containing protein [Herbaspirillum lusitanum]|uniref:ATP-binding cassette domain-containing protein n=1 Tax=Herbaspirillum lusitanum TaxID=213312 RepID=A0ABW9A6J6_9BURK